MELTAEKVYKNLLWQDPDRMGGVVCFYGTRVPLSMFFESLKIGESIDEFLESTPTVDRKILLEILDEVPILFDRLIASQ